MKVPLNEKCYLSVQEASAYFNISDKTLREHISNNRDATYIFWKHTRPIINRKLFEEYMIESGGF